ncbi:MAG: hypothetical protein GXZ06_10605 [Tissierellia bacterium]|nr:hypothetical protein [Tissierellia bacterium]
MLKKTGFLLIESLMGIFLLSIITVSCLPLITSHLYNIRLNKKKAEMVYVLESSMEKIINYNLEFPNDEYIMDVPVGEIIDIFINKDSATINLPLMDKDNWDYLLNIYKENINDRLWRVQMEISHKGEKRIKNVTLQSIIPIKD